MIPGDTVNFKKVKDRTSSTGLPRVTLIRANLSERSSEFLNPQRYQICCLKCISTCWCRSISKQAVSQVSWWSSEVRSTVTAAAAYQAEGMDLPQTSG